MSPRARITEDDVRAGRARLVTRKGYVMAEWAPAGAQLRIPLPVPQANQGKR